MSNISVQHSGTMQFWGDWFGRPMDNIHRATQVGYDESTDVLTIIFDNEEKCVIYSPVGITSTEKTFYIEDATAVIWSWYYYGREHTEQNHFRITYTKESKDTILCQKEEFSGILSVTHLKVNGSFAVKIW